MFADLASILADGTEQATQLITSSDWDTVVTTVTETAKTAIIPALGILAIIIGIPLAKKVFKSVSR